MRLSSTRLISLLAASIWTLLGVDFVTAAEPKRPAQADWATPPYITLSQRNVPYVNQLPVLGTIEWTLHHLDLIEAGPEAGISGAAMLHCGDAIYLCGGFIPRGDETTEPARRTSRWALRYDLKSKRWQKLPDMPGRKEYVRGLAHGDGVYIVGGLSQKATTDGFSAALAEVYRLDTAADAARWQSHSRLNVARTHHATGTIGNLLVVSGGNEYRYDKASGVVGIHPSTMRDVTEVFDLDDPASGWRVAKPILGGPRGWMGSAVVDKRLYLFGGLKVITNSSGKPTRLRLNETVSYDPQADTWTRNKDVPFHISGWEGDGFRDRYVLLVGGTEAAPISPERMGQNTWNDIVFAYDTLEHRWLRMEGSTPPGGVYNDPGVVVIDDTIYIVGGEGPRGSHFNHFLIGKIRL